MKPVQIPSLMSIGTTVIELCEFKEKKKKKKKKNNNNMDKIVFSSNMKRKCYCSEIFHTQFCFDMLYTIKSPEVEIT